MEAEKHHGKPKERDRVVSAQSEHELKVVISAELHEKLQRIKGLLAHAKPDATYAELLEYMATQTLAQLEKKKGIVASDVSDTSQSGANPQLQAALTAAAIVRETRSLPSGVRLALPAAIRRAVFARAQGRCEYVGRESRRCTSRYCLELDHIVPLALGGANNLNNFRVICRHHNAQQAQEKLGYRS